MKISHVMLTMGRREIVEDCFHHNYNNAGRKPDEIVWVDNGSGDGTADFARSKADICVLNRRNLGMARGFNTGFSLATGDMIAMLGAYSKAPENWLQIMVDVYESSKVDGVCIFHDSVDAEPSRFRGGIENHAGRECQRTLFLEAQLFPRSVFDKYGYFDEALDPYWPCDVEYAFRVDHHGFKALAIKGLIVKHCGRGNDVNPMMPNPDGSGPMPYWAWKKAVQWSPQVHARINSNAEAGWPRLGLNQKPL